MFSDFFALFYPRICAACSGNLSAQEEYICMSCQYHLPQTNYSGFKDNPLSKLFWGRTSIETATSYFYFSNDSKVQRLIHQLKYKGQKELGIYLGEQYGRELKQSPLFMHVDKIIPVPLHAKKLKKRGYNQAEYFAQGLSNSMNIPVLKHTLRRVKESGTQTKKTRYERWENVENIFRLVQPTALIGKHILLVDDVITTGSTIEACASKLLEIEGLKISMASIAFAERS